jgi:hypothetical protein
MPAKGDISVGRLVFNIELKAIGRQPGIRAGRKGSESGSRYRPCVRRFVSGAHRGQRIGTFIQVNEEAAYSADKFFDIGQVQTIMARSTAEN